MVSEPAIEDVFRLGTSVRVSVQTVAGKNYTLQRNASMSGSSWLGAQSITGDGFVRVLVDTKAVTSRLDYRVRAE